MLFFDGTLSAVLFAVWVFCLIDVILTNESRMRNLGKIWWVLIVVLLADIGAILWLVAGRPWQGGGSVGARVPERAPEHAESDPPRRAVTNPDDDEEFLRQLRERAEEQRRRYREQQRQNGDDDPR